MGRIIRVRKKLLRRKTSGPTILDNGIVVAQTPEHCESVLRMLKHAPIVGVDTENVDCNPAKEHPKGKARIWSIQFSTPEHHRIFVQNWGEGEGNLRVFKRWLQEPKKKKVLHNAKYDMHCLANHGIVMDGLLADTMVMDYTLDTARFHGLKECIHDYFGENTVEYGETFRRPKLKKDGTPGKTMVVPSLREVTDSPEGIATLIDYGTKDPWYNVRLYHYLCKKLEELEWSSRGSMLDYYKQYELDYTGVLFRMEQRGCLLNEEWVADAAAQVSDDIVEIEKGFFRACMKKGVKPEYLETFNLGSGQQLGDLFENQLGCPIAARTPTGRPQTDDKALHSIRKARKVVEYVLEWRRLNKLLNTYVLPFGEYIEQYNGRLHTNYKQTGTRTNRLSSSTPNLQNVPVFGGTDKYGIRKAFVAPDGCVIGDGDLSQIEIRLMAHFTNDQVLLEALREGQDIHSLTTVGTFDEPAARYSELIADGATKVDALNVIHEEFPHHRKRGKTLNFGVGYGMSGFRYASMTGATEKEGERVIRKFFETYKGLARGIHRIQMECHTNGFIRTLLRRIVQVPEIHSQDFGTMKHGERAAFNYKVQGSAADLLKMAMLLIDSDERLNDLGVGMILQVHDELAFEIPKDAVEEVRPILVEHMAHPYRHERFRMKDLRIDTPADFGVGDNWAEAK